jgi:hypothetical protein
VVSPNHVDEVFDFDVRVSQGTLQRVAVNLIVEGKYNDAAIGMFHLQMAALSMSFDEAWPRGGRRACLPESNGSFTHSTQRVPDLQPHLRALAPGKDR